MTKPRKARRVDCDYELRVARREPLLTDQVAENLVDCFKLLADPTRLQILLNLTQQGELHVSALCQLLRQSQPAVSHHLGLLRSAGVIERRREGKHNFYHRVPSHCEEVLELVCGPLARRSRQAQRKMNRAISNHEGE